MADTSISSKKPADVINAPADENTITALQAIAERQASRVDELREKIRALNESMRSIFDNDNEYSSQEEYVKEASKRVKDRKSTLTQSPEFRELSAKTGELKDELKELEESLNGHLLSLYQQTGVKVFDTSNGSQREFKVLAKLLPKRMSAQDDDDK
jgi:predicted nuclease with TOPRIM domain